MNWIRKPARAARAKKGVTRHIIIFLAVVVLSVLGATCGVLSAQADPSGPFLTLSGTADTNVDYFPASAPLPAAHSAVLVRIAVTAGDAQFCVLTTANPDCVISTSDLVAGDVYWDTVGSYAAGDTPEVQVQAGEDGGSGATFSIGFYDEAGVPASFSGSSYLGGARCDTACDESELAWQVPGTAPYTAQVSLTGGAISINGTTIASPGSVSLGTLNAGSQEVKIDPIQGAPASWQITISPQPIAVSDVAFSQPSAAPGVINTLSYSVDGDTTVTIVVANTSGTIVRTLASGLAVTPGSHSVVWDGRTATAANVPQGTYTATITSTDPVGNVSHASATIAIKIPPPKTPVSTGLCQDPKTRPKIIVLAVDGSGALSGYSHHGHVGYTPGPTANLHWTVWTSTQGRASGYLWVDDGYPSIGGGTFYAVRASIRVWRPVGGVFTRLTITPHGSATFHPNKYWGIPKPMTLSAQSCSHGTWSW